MSILHLNVASFPIQVERLVHRNLAQRPVALAASSAPRSPLIAVSKEAYDLGIRKGMPQKRARDYERRLVCLLPNPRLYRRAQQRLLQVVSKFTPRYEAMRLGSVFLDLRGMELLLGRPAEAASRIRSEVLRELRLIPTLGVAENKLVSRIAAKVMRPQGLCEVFPGLEEAFLHPLEVDLLPGIGRVTSGKLLRELGVRRIGDLGQVPLTILTQLFGRAGLELHHKALGLDSSEVCLPERLPSLSREAILQEPSNDDDLLLSRLWEIAEQLGRELRATGRVAGRGVLEGSYADRQQTAVRFSIHPPSHSDFVLFRCCEARWRRFYSRRIRLKSLSLSLSELQTAFAQLDFTQDEREEQLLKTLDGLRAKYGGAVVRFGRGVRV